MTIKHYNLRIILSILATLVVGLLIPVKAQEADHRSVVPQKATLLSQIKYQDFARANFNFELGVRGDSESRLTRNVYDVRYGGLNVDGTNDWLDVPISHGSRSQMKDLGELNWSDVYDIPFLHAHPVPHDGAMRFSFNSGNLAEIAPEGVALKAVVGHLYLVHSKDKDRDFYVMFRVEAVKTGDECTITWKIVPSPEPQ